jgi:hypothetical protein
MPCAVEQELFSAFSAPPRESMALGCRPAMTSSPHFSHLLRKIAQGFATSARRDDEEW